MTHLNQAKRRDSVWWGSLILVIYGVVAILLMAPMMVQTLSDPFIPEEPGISYAEIQDSHPVLANWVWWTMNAFSNPGFIYPFIFTIPLAWWGLRNRHKWAWYTILIPNLILWLLFYPGCHGAHPETFASHWAVFTPFLVLFLIGMILPARKILAPRA